MAIYLEKKARIILEKKGYTKVKPMRVGFAIDVSGSTRRFFQNGQIQNTFDRILAVSKNLDDNGEMDMWMFDTKSTELPVATGDDYGVYIDREIYKNNNLTKWGGTSYAPVLKDVVQSYFEERQVVESSGGFLGFFAKKEVKTIKPENVEIPAMLFFITDGANDDKSATEKVIVEAQKYNIYLNMVGISDKKGDFAFLEKMADKYSHVGFIYIENFAVSEDELYDKIITDEVVRFLNK